MLGAVGSKVALAKTSLTGYADLSASQGLVLRLQRARAARAESRAGLRREEELGAEATPV